MKATSKRGSAVLDAPEEELVPESSWVEHTPAPAGALQRGYASALSEVPAGAADDAADPPPIRRRVALGKRLRGGVPKSTTGRVVAGSCLLVCFGAVTAAWMAARSYVLHDPRFIIPSSSQIQVEGNVHLSRAQLLSVFGEDVERNIFKVPLEDRRTELERLPWVAHATVMRLLPNRIRISIAERTPVAFVRQGSHIGLVDASGVLLDLPENTAGDPQYSFPVLSGLSPDDPLSTRAARMEIYRRFVQELDSAGQKISDTLSEVDVSNPEDVKALIPSGESDILVHFGDENFLERYRHFQDHLPEWKQQYPKLASADMRYERQVVLEMARGAEIPVSDAPITISAAQTPGMTSITRAALEVAAEKQAEQSRKAQAASAKANHASPAASHVAAAAPAHIPAPPAHAPAVAHLVAATPGGLPGGGTKAGSPHHAPAGAVSTSNEKMFAALAAARKAQAAKANGAGPR